MKILRLSIVLLIIIFCFAIACRASKVTDLDVREPAVAGKFYPESAAKLKLAVEKLLQEAIPAKVKKPVAIIVPHAGYIYSGQICADGFKQVTGQQFDFVVILGTKHTNSDIEKIALYPGDGFRTPLGTVLVEKNIIHLLKKTDPIDCMLDKSLHETEHSIEVMVPFIQIVFPKAKIVPIVIGSQNIQTCIRFGQALAKVLKNKNALIIASSDLSHYPSAEDANIIDRETLSAIAGLDPVVFQNTLQSQRNRNLPNLYTSACGEAPIIVAMAAAKSLGASYGSIISYANSGDTSIGERSRVVGYGAVVLTADGVGNDTGILPQIKQTDPSATLTPSDKKTLLTFARKTLSRLFSTDTAPLARNFSAILQQPRGVFVTLKKRGELRGCIGRIVGDEPLGKIVGTMAIQAAFNDARFNPLTADELKDVEIEISVLTPIKPIAGATDVVVGQDGVLLNKEGHQAVFLPQVATEQKWNREELLDNLCRKSGLETGCWKKDAQLSTFQTVVFSESEFR
ncbi:putative acr [hydrocarbon metagenome]|uniref:Putative acr n=1 Tax=hydrocarbon metagenome TaxID=938273 RepID=A0A0W8FR19_9ZZZZ